MELHGTVWWGVGAANLGGRGRIGLLRAIGEHGSITAAAKAIGMSYKAAWDAVDTMNNLAGLPLVERSAGGRGGGSTRLTPRGQRLIARFDDIDALHRRYVQRLGAAAEDDDLTLLRTLTMRTSVRNQLHGTVSAVRAGAVNDEVELSLPGGERIVAIITRESTETLDLRLQASAFALVPATAIMLAPRGQGGRLSARNQLPGRVSGITPGAVNAEVRLQLDGGASLAAIVTQAGLQSLEVSAGDAVLAIFDAASVIVGVAA